MAGNEDLAINRDRTVELCRGSLRRSQQAVAVCQAVRPQMLRVAHALPHTPAGPSGCPLAHDVSPADPGGCFPLRLARMLAPIGGKVNRPREAPPSGVVAVLVVGCEPVSDAIAPLQHPAGADTNTSFRWMFAADETAPRLSGRHGLLPPEVGLPSVDAVRRRRRRPLANLDFGQVRDSPVDLVAGAL
jgi:hypothetical protein